MVDFVEYQGMMLMLVVRSSPLIDDVEDGMLGKVQGCRRRAVEWKLPSPDKFG
jgi:hypothetical protein